VSIWAKAPQDNAPGLVAAIETAAALRLYAYDMLTESGHTAFAVRPLDFF